MLKNVSMNAWTLLWKCSDYAHICLQLVQSRCGVDQMSIGCAGSVDCADCHPHSSSRRSAASFSDLAPCFLAETSAAWDQSSGRTGTPPSAGPHELNFGCWECAECGLSKCFASSQLPPKFRFHPYLVLLSAAGKQAQHLCIAEMIQCNCCYQGQQNGVTAFSAAWTRKAVESDLLYSWRRPFRLAAGIHLHYVIAHTSAAALHMLFQRGSGHVFCINSGGQPNGMKGCLQAITWNVPIWVVPMSSSADSNTKRIGTLATRPLSHSTCRK